MASQIRNVTFDCHDHYALMQFWAQVLEGYGDDPDDPNNPDHPESVIVGPPGSPDLLFQPVPEDKTVKNRVHLCLQPADRTRDEEVDRLLLLGARAVGDHRNPDGTGWVTMTDPEGNELCVLRSAAERVPGP